MTAALRWSSLVLLSAAVACGTCDEGEDRGAVEPDSDERAPEGSAPIRWQEGRAYRYALAWNNETHTELPSTEQVLGRSLDGALRIEGELVLRSHRSGPDGTLLTATLENLSELRFELAGEALLPPGDEGRAALEGQRAVLEIDPRGRIESLAFPEEVPDGSRRLIRSMLRSIHVGLPEEPAPRWEVTQHGLLGEQRVRYRRDFDDPLTLERQRLRYTRFTGLSAMRAADSSTEAELEGRGTLHFAPEGHLVGLDDRERTVLPARRPDAPPLLSATSRLTLELLDSEPLAAGDEPPPPDELEPMDDDDRPDPFDRAMAARFADGLTADQMAVAILNVGRGLSLERGMMVRMVGLARSDEDALRSLAPLFAREELGHDGRALVADVLSSAGTPEAQAVLRDVLRTRVARSHPSHYALLLQRFSLVWHPEPESAAFVWAEIHRAREEGQPLVSRAAIYSIGSVISHLYADGEEELASRYEAQLLEAMASEDQDDFIQAHLAALGNIERLEHLDRILSYRDHPSQSVRAQVPTSLRDLDTPRVREALIELSTSDDLEIAMRALGSLSGRSLTRGELQALSAAVQDGSIDPRAFATLRILVKRLDGHREERVLVLEQMIERLEPGRELSDTQILLDDIRSGRL